MKFADLSRHRWCWQPVCLLLLLAAAPAPAKLIRLHNQLIPAKPLSQSAKAAAAGNPSVGSGLYLLQFHTPPGVEERAQLEALGVDLLHYVPEDTFVARFRNTRLGLVRALPFVDWVGDYRPEHKVHRSLSSRARALKAGESLEVTILLTPRADAADEASARSLLARIRQQSRLRSGTVLRGQLRPGQLDALARSPAVLWVEPAPHFKLVDEVASKIVAGDGGPGTLYTQSLGYDGSGVRVAVADSGLDNGDAASMHPDLFGRTPRFFFYGALTDAADEHSHGTHVAGIVAGNGATGETDENGALYGLGVAPGASIIAQRIFDADGNFEAPINGFSELTSDAVGAGAVVGSNSWGDDTQGRYDVSAMEFDELVRDATGYGTNNQPYILEFSAGNAGPGTQTMDSPAVAKNVIATGACENDRPDFLIYADGADAMADFSSRGPCEDGRIKPDVVAPGTWISSLQSASATDQYAWMPIDNLYQYQGGTSQAGPHASGAAAVFVQYYRLTHTNATPSPALVKAALINSATDMDDSFGTGPVPNMDEGWGRIDLATLVDPTMNFEFIEQGDLLTNSQVFEHSVLIASRDEPLKITLAYSDVPGFPGAIPALVNDLDLEVVAPDGHLYRGNQFNIGESIPDAPAPDSLNNVEAVHLGSPVPGQYLIRVRARKIVQDVLGASGTPRQDFALVISGTLPIPGVGALFFDRGSYTAPSRIQLTLIDTDQAGHASETVHISSTTEPLGESVVLTPSSSGGSFTGSIATATGPAAADGRLQIANNDLIQVVYADASSGTNQIATARGDLVAPVLSSVGVTNSFGQAIVFWNTDEPSTSIVRFGTNGVLISLTLAVTNLNVAYSHSVALTDLIPGGTYYYYVVSADEAGNYGTNLASGAPYVFVMPTNAPLLLVDEYGVDPISGGVPSLTGYTDPLDALGVRYDVWDASTGNQPTNVLKSYRAVIWRVPELSGEWNVSERAAISNYLHNGGSLFVSSMQVLYLLESEASDSAFKSNVLQVQSYEYDQSSGGNSTGAAAIVGSGNETVGSGMDVALDYSEYADRWSIMGFPIVDPPDISETIIPTTNAMPVLRNDVGDIVGLRWPAIGQQAPGRLVFFSFPIDAVPMGNGVNDRINLFRNVISFLAPGVAGLATVSLDSSAYTLPSVVTVEAGDGNLAGQGTLTVTASTLTQPSGIPVVLQETLSRGEFVGSFTLVSATNTVTGGQLRATNGDTLRVTYFSTTAGKEIAASATVDTDPPVISGVFSDPDYQQATIYWDTSELCDSMIQFGESPLLGRTAYDSNPTTSHAVTLPGLAYDHTYYYQVVSRDLAGNTTVDDNGGTLYTLHTLLPLTPPWSDNMDTGATNWSVYSDPSSSSQWALGVPNNSLETSAFSPPDAWGSNLYGDANDGASTFLISPAIALPPGAGVTLRFMHSYDFSLSSEFDIYENGTLYLITNNNATSPITLTNYLDDEFSLGWEEQVLDLTPYAGHVIYLAWDYEMFSFDTREHPGWLVDNVSLTVSAGGGTIIISNNLWQAVAVLSGPVARTNSGLSGVIANAPAGSYTLTWSAVPYYITPPSQTTNLSSGGTAILIGNYTFPDVNANGISDLWEQRFFGNVSTNRNRFTDTDGDGMADYAEFMAGTDPNSPPAQFRLTPRRLSAASCRLEWPTVPSQQYRVLVSTNLNAWTAYSAWIEATGTLTSVTVPLTSTTNRAFFRVQAGATNSPAGLAPNLKVSAQRQADGSFKLLWNSSIGRGYRVIGSTNVVVWAPLSSWMQATNQTTTFSLPVPTKGAPNFFRIEVAP